MVIWKRIGPNSQELPTPLSEELLLRKISFQTSYEKFT